MDSRITFHSDGEEDLPAERAIPKYLRVETYNEPQKIVLRAIHEAYQLRHSGATLVTHLSENPFHSISLQMIPSASIRVPVFAFGL